MYGNANQIRKRQNVIKMSKTLRKGIKCQEMLKIHSNWSECQDNVKGY